MRTGESLAETYLATQQSDPMATEQQADTPRRQWPELVGKTGEEAKEVILATAGLNLKSVDIIPEDSMYTTDFRTDRVRIFVDGNGRVAKTPIVG